MTLAEIKDAVRYGFTVHWANEGYRVIRGKFGDYLIVHHRGNTIGLTWQDGVTLNGREEEFFIANDGKPVWCAHFAGPRLEAYDPRAGESSSVRYYREIAADTEDEARAIAERIANEGGGAIVEDVQPTFPAEEAST